jgi:hypothetical protein
VPHPQLYEWYSAADVISFFGSQSEIQRLCDDQWLIFSASAACLVNIGEPPKNSHFEKASTFCWMAERLYYVNDETFAHFLPVQAVGSSKKNCPIHLFVRPLQAEKYVYVGQLEPCCRMEMPGRRSHGMAFFKLKQALPSGVWERLGGLRLGNLDFAAVDRALDGLRYPMTPEDRFGVLQQLVNYWHGPIRPEDGMSDAEIGSVPLPLPLRWWYRWAGKRTEVMSGQNFLHVPRDYQNKYRMVSITNGRLRFYSENQGVYQWSTLTHGDDPPVFGRYEGKGRWANERIMLSEHLILMCLFEAVMCHAKYGASAAWLEEDRLDEIVRNIPPLAIRPWRWLGMKFFAEQGAFMWAAENRNPKVRKKYRDGEKRYYSVHVGAKTEHPLQFLKPLLNDKWGYVAF